MTRTIDGFVVGVEPKGRTNKGKYNWPRAAEVAKANPGEWVQIFESDRYSTALSAIRMPMFGEGSGYRFTTNKVGEDSEGRGLVRLSLIYNPADDHTNQER